MFDITKYEITNMYELFLIRDFHLFKDGYFSFGAQRPTSQVKGWPIMQQYNNSDQER